MQVRKAHGTGNDFVVVIDLDDSLSLDEARVRALCDRRLGVGGDGLIRIGAVPGGQVGEVFMDYRNADGSIVEMCGNGVRVVAKIVVDEGLHRFGDGPGDKTLGIATRAGLRTVVVHRDDRGEVASVTVDMGPASRDPDIVGLVVGQFTGTIDAFHLVSSHGIDDIAFAGVSMGNPHAVTLTDDVRDWPVTTLGPLIETHPAFANDVNVNVVEVVDPHNVRLRVWERGVGETAACGTGACATTAVLAASGHVDLSQPVTVALPGGDLVVERGYQDHLLMTGPAEVVANIELDPSWLRQHLS